MDELITFTLFPLDGAHYHHHITVEPLLQSPLTRGRATNRIPNDIMLKYYSQRAEYAGLLVTEGTTINEENSNGWTENAGIYTQEQCDGWKPIVKAVHELGCLFVVQLWHMGRAAHSSFLPPGNSIVAPSPIAINGATFGSADGMYGASGVKVPYEVPKELTLEEIDALVEDYVKCAKFAKEAGFDGIEIHSGNGYLLDNFLQSSTNHRTDSYGGSPENRIFFLTRILDAVTAVYPSTSVGVRLSPNGIYNDMGSDDNYETFSYYIKVLGQKNLAFLDVMDGLAFGFHNKGAPLTIDVIRKEFGKNPLVCNCGYTRDSAEKVLAAGDADAVMFGRPFISNPDLPYRFAHDLPLAADDHSTWFSHEAKGYSDFPKHDGTV